LYKRAALNSESFREQDFRGLELIRELDDEDRDRFPLLLVVRSGHFHCLGRAQRERAAKDERDSGQKPRDCTARLGCDLIRN